MAKRQNDIARRQLDGTYIGHEALYPEKLEYFQWCPKQIIKASANKDTILELDGTAEIKAFGCCMPSKRKHKQLNEPHSDCDSEEAGAPIKRRRHNE